MKDVFRGKWNGYVITANPKCITLENTVKSYGIYWLWVYGLVLLICFDCLVFMFIKRRLSKTL